MNRTTTHPGDVLKEELEARGISQKKFSEVLRIPYTQLNEILNGKRPVTTDFALMMEAALGINPEMLINMQTRYNMSVARQKKSLLERLIDIKRLVQQCFRKCLHHTHLIACVHSTYPIAYRGNPNRNVLPHGAFVRCVHEKVLHSRSDRYKPSLCQSCSREPCKIVPTYLRT